MHFTSTAIPDIILIEPDVYEDERGFFMETYHQKHFIEAGVQANFKQVNHSGSKKGTLRGLHYQICQPQAKLVRVVLGEIFDVAVDLRRSSASFGKWIGMTLTAENKHQLWVPEGFAHGFYVLSEWAEIIYKASNFYAPECERTLLWNDPTVGIEWPLLEDCPLILAPKDKLGKKLDQIDLFD
jgi:dTDP-4-dehydrorhamnose 3,5-epimerase